jgi:hypothetical protein
VSDGYIPGMEDNISITPEGNLWFKNFSMIDLLNNRSYREYNGVKPGMLPHHGLSPSIPTKSRGSNDNQQDHD